MESPPLQTTDAAQFSKAVLNSEGDIQVPTTLRRALNALLAPVLLAALVSCGGGGGDGSPRSVASDGGGTGGSGGALMRLTVGTYKYYIYNFSSYAAEPIAQASARVELNIPGHAPELYTPPASGELSSAQSWLLFELDVDATCTVTVRRQGSYSDGEPTTVATSPVYCSR